MTETHSSPAFLFDLDGTLVDSVYQHVIAWRGALASMGIDVAVWRIHRRIGMSGGLFVSALMSETGIQLDAAQVEQAQSLHAQLFDQQRGSVRPLPGAKELLQTLTHFGVPWAVATSGRGRSAHATLEMLEVPSGVPVVTRDEVRRAKPDPDLFLAAAQRLGVDPAAAMVVGDSVWDLLAARRAGTLGVGVLSGGYGRDELERAGAFRVYAEPAEMLTHLHELGVRTQ